MNPWMWGGVIVASVSVAGVIVIDAIETRRHEAAQKRAQMRREWSRERRGHRDALDTLLANSAPKVRPPYREVGPRTRVLHPDPGMFVPAPEVRHRADDPKRRRREDDEDETPQRAEDATTYVSLTDDLLGAPAPSTSDTSDQSWSGGDDR